MLSLPPSFLWLLFGFLCLFSGMLGGEPIFSAALGLAALITGIAALSVPNVAIQIILWGVLTIAVAAVLHSMAAPRGSIDDERREAIVTETIPKGGMGMVTYEGALWRARCQISDIAIAPKQIVHVVGRQGLTLMVLPTTFSDEFEDISDRPRIRS